MIRLLLSLSLTSAYLIASSQLETCSDTGSALNCTSSKLVATISLENDQLVGTETLEAYITSATTASGEKTPLQFPIKIQASKSIVSARYPLRYQQDFNNKPRELVLSESLFECSADAYTADPTCGWKLDDQGQKIWDSQGYCCSCTVMQTLGLDTDSNTRGNQCQALNLGAGYSTAHCIVWDQLWYSAYQIGPFSTYYTIDIQITFPDENGNYTLSTMRLSPSVQVQQVRGVEGRIVGDFYPTTPPPVLESKVLLTPSQPSDNSRVLMGSRRWMIMDKTQIDYDGTECNKIGTSYNAFNNQPNKCQQLVQSCFHSQLDDFDAGDMQRVAQGLQPLYLLSAWGNFTYLLWNNDKYLQLNIDGKFSTMLTLEMNADKLVFVTSVSNGKIDYAFVNSFESLSYNGMLTCQVSSTGRITAQFTLTVNCTEGIAPIPAALFSLPPGLSTIKTFPVNTEHLTGQTYNCTAVLWNALGFALDNVTVTFNTTTRSTDLGTEGGSGNTPTGANATGDSHVDLTCSDLCPSWFDVPCFFVKSCWSSFMRFLGILLLIAVTLVAIKFVIRRYGICCQRLCKDRGTEQSKAETPKKTAKLDPHPQVMMPKLSAEASVLYYNFHYGIPDLGIYRKFSAKGVVTPLPSGEFEFVFGKSKLQKFLKRQTKKGFSDTLRLTQGEAYSCLSQEPFYNEFQPKLDSEVTEIDQ